MCQRIRELSSWYNRCLTTWLHPNLKENKHVQHHIRFTPTGGPLFTSSLSSYGYDVDSCLHVKKIVMFVLPVNTISQIGYQRLIKSRPHLIESSNTYGLFHYSQQFNQDHSVTPEAWWYSTLVTVWSDSS